MEDIIFLKMNYLERANDLEMLYLEIYRYAHASKVQFIIKFCNLPD